MNDYQSLELRNELSNLFFNKKIRMKQSFLEFDYTDDEIRESFDDSLFEFMNEKFGNDWETHEEATDAMHFYENIGCDLRFQSENEMIDFYHENF
jgi:hypothetical protein